MYNKYGHWDKTVFLGEQDLVKPKRTHIATRTANDGLWWVAGIALLGVLVYLCW